MRFYNYRVMPESALWYGEAETIDLGWCDDGPGGNKRNGKPFYAEIPAWQEKPEKLETEDQCLDWFKKPKPKPMKPKLNELQTLAFDMIKVELLNCQRTGRMHSNFLRSLIQEYHTP